MSSPDSHDRNSPDRKTGTGGATADFAAGVLFAKAMTRKHGHVWVPPSVSDLQRLLPRYEVRALIGRGGMGAVYHANHPGLEREVAIKLLPAELTDDIEFVERFRREARILASLDHPGIVRIHDFGQTPEEHLFFVMEFVDGADLRTIMHAGGLDAARSLDIAGQICDALHYAHGQGVVHRDIKPANILLTRNGIVKLADFGLARPLETPGGQLTLSRVAMGTPDYMAPEQKRGEGDSRADLYAVGVLLYEMLCGVLPQGAWHPPSRRVPVDTRIDRIVARALQPEPENRYQKAGEMKSAIESVPCPVRRRGNATMGFLLAACLLPPLAGGIWLASRHTTHPAGGNSAANPAGNPVSAIPPRFAGLEIRDELLKRAEVFDGHTYCFVVADSSWTDADAYSRQVGGHLVTITSPREQKWLLDHGGNWFIGGRRPESVANPRDKKNFTWVTGEPMDYDGWSAAGPGSSPGSVADEPFMALCHFDGPGWHDYPGKQERINGFIIEWDSVIIPTPPPSK